MANRSRKKGPPFGHNRGDRGSPASARAVSSRYNVTHMEGVYKNRWMVQSLTSQIGCEVEVEMQSGTVYVGILRTVSPQMEFAIELASVKSLAGQESHTKSSIIPTLVLKWNDLVRVSVIIGTSPEQKDIFKVDSEIGSHANGHAGKKELQPFVFEEEESVTRGLEEEGEDKGWSAQDMFDTNKEKFNVTSTFNPEMTEYTTPLLITDAEEDKARLEEAEKKAREIETSEKSHHVNDDTGTEEELFSSVVRQETKEEPKSMALPTESAQEEIKDFNGEDKGQESDNIKSSMSQLDVEDTDTSQTINGKIEPGTESPQTESETGEPSSDNVRKFKLNPDAKEFKPSSNSPSSSSSTSTISPPSTNITTSYSNTTSRITRHNHTKGGGPRNQQRPPLFNVHEQAAAMYGYIPGKWMEGWTVMHPQGPQLAAVSGPLASPTGLVSVIRPPTAFPSQIIGHQGGHTHFYTAPTSLPGTSTHASLNQQLTQPAAILGHAGTPHSIGAAIAQGHNLVYLPTLPPSALGGPFIPAQQLAPIHSGLLSYPQPQGGGGK